MVVIEAQTSGRIKASTFELDVNILRQIVSYDARGGQLVWRHTHGMRVRGGTVGVDCGHGGMRVGIGGRFYALHRLTWFYVHGNWPDGFIDHIDGNPRNNRIENLREATCAQNLWNTRRSSKNTSGFKGVSWSSQTRSWRAYVSAKGKRHWLGYFKTKEDAFAARVAAANRLHGEFARHS